MKAICPKYDDTDIVGTRAAHSYLHLTSVMSEKGSIGQQYTSCNSFNSIIGGFNLLYAKAGEIVFTPIHPATVVTASPWAVYE